ncbi:MAG: aminotransferase class I/II-fold pyridoxal phosphate-dependent enzyme [Taibaiella sp.]|nr:aminotransferase class I/II-fold pyridoxal phosphate-dependent enzyme [Taibaiella sp.]MBX9450164.1 aminotransferase class I/II-fold pyridoxal phosphate-dependent enzyme [Taibaiella sp.]
MENLSRLAESLVGSEIVKLGNEINSKIAAGAKIYNYTIGDFSPAEFPIPAELLQEILNAYQKGLTNYPPGAGVLPLRKAVAHFIEKYEGIQYQPDEIQIASGGRPLIYTTFKTIVDPGDKVIYAVPSWNNNHYTNLNGGIACEIQTRPEHNFMPTAEDMVPYISDAVLLCLCTPQNPTGTTLSREDLSKICDLVVAENEKRGAGKKKLYVMFDQMYFTLTYGGIRHYNPVSINAKMKDYTILIDGVSKAFAATGIRVGWACGPKHIIAKINALLSHIGAWAPMAEQHAVAQFLGNDAAVGGFLGSFRQKVEERLIFIERKMKDLKSKGYPVDTIAAQAAIYLTIKFDLKGKETGKGRLETQNDVTQFLLNNVGMAVVPFHCFGADRESPWYRISVGTSNIADLESVFQKLEEELSKLK